MAYTHFTWQEHTLRTLKAKIGDCRFQTAFEFATLFIVADTFSEMISEEGALIRGDNLGALSVALKLSSTTPAMNVIARELAWRRIVRHWQYLLKHLPAEVNDEADALSRLEAEPRRDMPALGEAIYVAPPVQDARLWRCQFPIENKVSARNQKKMRNFHRHWRPSF